MTTSHQGPRRLTPDKSDKYDKYDIIEDCFLDIRSSVRPRSGHIHSDWFSSGAELEQK